MRIETTNIVTVNLSDKLKGIRPYRLMGNKLVLLNVEKRMVFNAPVTIFFMNKEENTKAQRLISSALTLADSLRKKAELIEEHAISSVVELFNCSESFNQE